MNKTKCIAKFSVPSDYKLETIEQYALFNKSGDMRVDETYGSLNPSLLNSGRSSSVIPLVDIAQLKEYVSLSYKKGIKFNYVLNISCASNRELFEESRLEIEAFIQSLINIGINRFTIVSHTFLSVFSKFQNIELSISTISQLYKPQGIKFLKSFLNVKRLCLPEFMNRDIRLLQKTIKLGSPIEFSVIINNMCLLECPFRHQHYNYYSHKHPDNGPDPNIIACSNVRLNNPESLIKSPWIRPEDIDLYLSKGVSYFKIAGRGMRNSNFIKMLEIYQSRKYKGNLIKLFRAFSPNDYWDILELPDELVAPIMKNILSKKGGCHEIDCDDCNICSNALKKNSLITDSTIKEDYIKAYSNYLKMNE